MQKRHEMRKQWTLQKVGGAQGFQTHWKSKTLDKFGELENAGKSRKRDIGKIREYREIPEHHDIRGTPEIQEKHDIRKLRLHIRPHTPKNI